MYVNTPMKYSAIFQSENGNLSRLFSLFLLKHRLWMLVASCLIEAVLMSTHEPRCEKTGLRGFRPGPTLTGLYNHTRWLEA